MIQKRTVNFVLLPMILMLAVSITSPTMAMEGGHKGGAHAMHGSMQGKRGHGKKHGMHGRMEGQKGHGKKHGMHGSMGLTMTNMMPGRTMKFLNHFKSWIEITPEQEPAWSAFSIAIKLQATTKPHRKRMMHMKMEVSPVVIAEMQIARAERMIQVKKNTLEAYKALLQVLDEQQARLADSFLAYHMTGHKGMKKGKRGH